MDTTLTERDRNILLTAARSAIAEKLGCSTHPDLLPSKQLDRPAGAFVTLRIGRKLRGCVGQITARRGLFLTVQEMARSSAFGDPRFPPLSSEELDRTRIEISVISPFREIRDPQEIIPGTHGVHVRRGYSSGLLLPQVATEQGWDRETFLSQTCRKAGLPADAWQDGKTEIQVFTAVIFSESEPGVFP